MPKHPGFRVSHHSSHSKIPKFSDVAQGARIGLPACWRGRCLVKETVPQASMGRLKHSEQCRKWQKISILWPTLVQRSRKCLFWRRVGSLQKITNSVSQNSNILEELDSCFCDNGENTESLLREIKEATKSNKRIIQENHCTHRSKPIILAFCYCLEKHCLSSLNNHFGTTTFTVCKR